MAGEVFYSVGEVAAMLGVSPHTVRAWERRHQVVSPIRSRSGQRRYRSEDVELLREVKRAINLNGLSLRLAVRAANGSEAIEHEPVLPVRAGRIAPGLLDDQNLWRGVVDAIPQLVFVIDRGGRVVASNIASARHFDTTVQQIRGRLFLDLVEPFDRAKAAMLYRPNSRTVEGWELNLATRTRGPMYSFKSWPVRRASDVFVVVVGTEMFTEPALQAATAADAHQGAEQVSAGAYHEWLDDLLADVTLHQAETAQQLGEAAVHHLQKIVPTVDFVIAIAAPPDSGADWSTTYSPVAERTFQTEPDGAEAFTRAIWGATSVGAREEIPTTIRGEANMVTAVPFSTAYRLGVLAWSRPTDDPLTGHQRRAVDAFLSWVAVATERLIARSETARRSSRLSDLVHAVSVLRGSGARDEIASNFLKELIGLVEADTAAIGRIEGSDFIVEAAYTPGGALTKRGDRFRLRKVFSTAVRTGRPARGTERELPGPLPQRLQRRYGQVRHFLAVPVVFLGRTSHLVSLARFGDRPFDQTDIEVVQALSSSAVLATNLDNAYSPPARSDSSI